MIKASPGMRSVLSAIPEMTAAQAAVSFILDNHAVSSCVVGTTRPKHLYEIIDSSGKSLHLDSKNAIRRAFDTAARISA